MPLSAYLLRLIFHKFWPYEIRGQAHIPQKGGGVIVANHASMLDGLLLYAALPRIPRFIVWTQHYEEALFGWIYRRIKAIPVDGWREEGGVIGPEAYRTAHEHLAQGGLLAVFPEGGRTPDGRFMCWRPGAARLALATRVPIIPITINGLYEAWPIYEERPHRGRLQIIVHPPVAVERWLSIKPRREAALLLTRHVRDIVASAYRLPAPEYAPPPGWQSPHADIPCPTLLSDTLPPYGTMLHKGGRA